MTPWEFPALVDFLLADGLHKPFSGFNGQSGRQSIIRELVATFGPRVFVETGTYLGDTAGWVATELHIPVWTCESEPCYAKVAARRLEGLPVAVCNRDSREILRLLLDLTKEETFFYLDAHWREEHPLSTELELIAEWRPSGDFVVMIDDFEVPDDPGYTHDGYSMAQFGGLFEELGLVAYFPESDSEFESLPRRGCVVLVPEQRTGRMGGVKKLRRYASLEYNPVVQAVVEELGHSFGDDLRKMLRRHT